jgi:3-hydroxyacyl-CoA dehydrogenase
MMSEKQEKIAEVIAAETAAFTAQSYELYELPPLGSLVKAGETYAVVCHAETAGLDTGRKPVARGRDEATEEAVYSASPQLSKLLRSSFTAAAVGYKEGGKVYQYLPPRPAKLHSFVYLCQPEEAKEFAKNLSFLNILVNAQLPVSTEEVMAAALRQMAKA